MHYNREYTLFKLFDTITKVGFVVQSGRRFLADIWSISTTKYNFTQRNACVFHKVLAICQYVITGASISPFFI